MVVHGTTGSPEKERLEKGGFVNVWNTSPGRISHWDDVRPPKPTISIRAGSPLCSQIYANSLAPPVSDVSLTSCR